MKEASFSSKTSNKEYLDDPPQPREEDPIPNLAASRRYRGVRYLPAVFPEGEIDILFVSSTPLPEEASETTTTPHGMEIPRQPGLGTGPVAQMIKETVDRFPALHRSRVGFVSLVPWLLPKTRRYKPSKNEIQKCIPWLEEVVAQIKPKVIVALGSIPFKALCDCKLGYDDARAGWFSTRLTKTPVFLGFSGHVLLTQPWMQDALITDLKEVDRFLTQSEVGTDAAVSMRVIDTTDHLRDMVGYWKVAGFKCYSVDCEWGKGANHLTADLRSIQFCWSDTETAYLRFYNEDGDRFLGAIDNERTDYKAVGQILNEVLAGDDITFIGHHATADSPFMSKVLGIPVRGKFVFDSEYALQTIDEYAPRGLEALALRYTRLGRYDMDLVMWKKENPALCLDGYHKIPDSILIPYACLDTVVVWKSRAPIERRMASDDVLGYYRSILNPFVTDVFHDFVVEGLPVNLELFYALRTFMNWCYRVLLEDFVTAITWQADEIAGQHLHVSEDVATKLRLEVGCHGQEVAATRLAPLAGLSCDELQAAPWFCHWLEIDKFNIRSQPAMRRWLFEVSGFTPVKTTKGGPDKPPSMLWEKALALPPAVRATLNPAADKETLEILEKDDKSGLIARLLAVSNVGNQCKGFLKEGDVDPATGEIVSENGLAKFIGPDNKIHGQFSLTETGRPRSWSPNILNLSSYHNKGVENGLIRILDSRPELEIPAECEILLGTRAEIEEAVAAAVAAKPEENPAKVRKGVMLDIIKTRIPTVRSIVCAIPGWCFVESDYKTAEIRGLAFIYRDRALIKLMTEPDPSFGLTKKGEEVRLSYDKDSGIPEDKQHAGWIMTVAEDGKVIQRVTEEDLDRDEQGNLKHPPFDLHWTLAELVYKTPREELSKKADRGSAKVANFSCVPECLILSDKGKLQLTQLSVDNLVWDGVEFVHHEGVKYQGVRLTIHGRGIRATPDHGIFTKDGEMLRFIESAVGDLCEKLESPTFTPKSHNSREGSRDSGAGRERGSIQVSAPALANSKRALSLHEAEMPDGNSREQFELPLPGDSTEDRIGTRVHSVGDPELAARDVQGQGFRQDQQLETLRFGELEVGHEIGKPEKHQELPQRNPEKGGEVHGVTPRDQVRISNGVEHDPAGKDAGGDSPPPQCRCESTDSSGEAGKLKVLQSPPTAGSLPGPESFGETDLQAVSSGVFGLPGIGVLLAASGFYHHSGAGSDCGGKDRDRLLGQDNPHLPEAGYDRGADCRSVELHERKAREVLVEKTRNRGDHGHHVDRWLELAEKAGFDGLAELAALEALGLKPSLQPVFDISDCGPNRRFMVLEQTADLGKVPDHVRREIANKPRRIHRRGHDFEVQEDLHGEDLPQGSYPSGRPLQSGDSNECDRSRDLSGETGGHAQEVIRGVIVGNCAYGAVASTIERRIEAVTGIKPAEGTGELLLVALHKRQPDVFNGLDEVAKYPERGEKMRAASGRVRRFPTHDPSLSGLSWRARQSYLRAMGNEARNFYPQESVASTLARACTWLNSWYRAEGLKARSIIGLYDSVLTYCPQEERHVVAIAHETYMCTINFWKYGLRYMNYPIDTDLVERWSYPPPKPLKKLLEDESYCVMEPERSGPILDRLKAREKIIFDAQPWVLKNLNKAEITE